MSNNNYYNTKERIFLVQTYYANNRSYTTTQTIWAQTYPDRSKPHVNMIRSLIKKFERFGSVLDGGLIRQAYRQAPHWGPRRLDLDI